MPMRYAENLGYKNGHFRLKKNLRIFFYILIKTKIVGTGKNCNIEVVVTFTYNLHFRAKKEVMYATKTLILLYKKWGLNYI